MKFRFNLLATAAVVPVPPKGSKTKSPSLELAFIINFNKSSGI
jgi:hypothetical protein